MSRGKRESLKGQNGNGGDAVAGARAFCQESKTDIPVNDTGRSDGVRYEANLEYILGSSFPNGIRYNSRIDQNRFRRAYQAEFDVALPEDFDLANALPRLGVVQEEKVFPRPRTKNAGWRRFVENLIAEGFTLFSYNRLLGVASCRDDVFRCKLC